jgi:hypothetical protein
MHLALGNLKTQTLKDWLVTDGGVEIPDGESIKKRLGGHGFGLYGYLVAVDGLETVEE